MKEPNFQLPECLYQNNTPTLIPPNTQTPTHTLYLSNLDDQRFLRFTIKYLFLFKDSINIDKLKCSLSRVLVDYYPLAGRLVTASGDDYDDDQKLEVLCNGKGAVFAQASMDLSVDEFVEVCERPNRSWRKLLYRVDAPSFLHVPPLVVQVTNLRGGGMILCTGFNHCLCDGIGTSQFLHAWAHFIRDDVESPIPPIHDRHVLKPRTNPKLPLTLPAFTKITPQTQNPQNTPQTCTPNITRYLPSKPLSTSTLHTFTKTTPETCNSQNTLNITKYLQLSQSLSASTLNAFTKTTPQTCNSQNTPQACNSQNTPQTCNSQNAPNITKYLQSQPLSPVSITFSKSQIQNLKAPLKCTAFEALAAHTWRSWARSLDLPPELTVKLLFSVDFRRRISPELPPGFYGNGFVLACATAPAKNLTGSTLRDTVRLIQIAKSEINDDYVRSAIDLLGDGAVRTDMAASLVISQWSRLGLEELDFGEGKPLVFGPLSSEIYCLFVPAVGDVNAARVLISLPMHIVGKFEYYMTEFVERDLVEGSINGCLEVDNLEMVVA